MKKALAIACVATAAMFMTEGTASAQCYSGYGGGYGYGYGSGVSLGYSRYSPRSSFSIGFNSAPRYNYGYGYAPRSYGYGVPSTIYRHRNHYHAVPGITHRRPRW